MGPRLQWALLFLAVCAVAAYLIYVGGNGPCFGNMNYYACHHSSGSRFG